MKGAVLDTSFILTCIKQKIDFFQELYLMGIKVLIPEQVVKEIQGIANDGNSKKAQLATLTLEILDKNKFKKFDLRLKNVDKGILKYAEKNSELYIATLDREIKIQSNNPKIVIREKKRLEII
jgi:rRNA-processing protein FCF1